MGFYLRKSFKMGPMRLNVSKSGLGVSAGVKGARISVGPRGTYLNAGRHGLYYRKKLDGGPSRRRRSAPPVPTIAASPQQYATHAPYIQAVTPIQTSVLRPALLMLICYVSLVLWPLGLVLNIRHWLRARQVRRLTGYKPRGMFLLPSMFFICGVLPIALVVLAILFPAHPVAR